MQPIMLSARHTCCSTVLVGKLWLGPSTEAAMLCLEGFCFKLAAAILSCCMAAAAVAAPVSLDTCLGEVPSAC